MIEITPYTPAHWPEIWTILEPVFYAGETYAYATDITESQAHAVWINTPKATYVALEDGEVLGTFYIKPNQPALGAHVCNCGYVVGPNARGKGVAAQMCDFSQGVAVQMGFSSMQYNLVAASNEGAVRLWQRHGFQIIGTLPKAFNHQRLGLVDAHVMYKTLTDD
ncbi:MAG: GNAT family N-acetyltransferase [Alphaproteobacteria bacterium]